MPTRPLASVALAQHPCGPAAVALLNAALDAVEPMAAVHQHLRRADDTLWIGAQRYVIAPGSRVVLLAVGKAALPMAAAAYAVAGSWIDRALVVTKDADPACPLPSTAQVIVAGHPIPSEASVAAGEQALAFVAGVAAKDLLLVLLSGGGSALLCAPVPGLSLPDLQALTGTLLAVGAPITAINALRRRLDRVKGGGLAAVRGAGPVAVLVLSDVLGDDLAAIASGPFVGGSEPELVAATIQRYGLREQLPPVMLQALDAPVAAIAERAVPHTIIGHVWTAVEAAAQAARAHGYNVQVSAAPLVGEAREVGPAWLAALQPGPASGPQCWLAGGETTVTLQGNGRGGRNQELALSCVRALAGRDVLLITLATDGGDGPTDAAGAVVDGSSLRRAALLGLDPDDFLARNDAYHFFATLGDLLQPGPTGTNVNDLTVVLAP